MILFRVRQLLWKRLLFSRSTVSSALELCPDMFPYSVSFMFWLYLVEWLHIWQTSFLVSIKLIRYPCLDRVIDPVLKVQEYFVWIVMSRTASVFISYYFFTWFNQVCLHIYQYVTASIFLDSFSPWRNLLLSAFCLYQIFYPTSTELVLIRFVLTAEIHYFASIFFVTMFKMFRLQYFRIFLLFFV